ncbi:MAG: hypothetical protein ACM34A_12030 [Bacillota bacterium]
MILTPEVRALLKRMDADDAIDKAVELALEAAAKVCEAMHEEDRPSDYAYAVRALKDSK